MEKFLAVPTQGPNGKPRVVPFPGRATPLAQEGEPVLVSTYWERRKAHGEVSLLPVAAKPSTDSPAPVEAPESPQQPKRQKDAR